MKCVLILILIFLIFSCDGVKKTIEDQPKTTKESPIKNVEKTLKVVAVSPIPQPEFKIKLGIKKRTTPFPSKSPKQTSNYKELIHNKWNSILQNHVSYTGNVNYKAIKNNKIELDIYINYLSDTFPDNTWSKNEKLAYWINAYNALTIDLILRNYPIKSIKDIKKPWDQRLWKFGKKWYNLNDIEHTILRKMNEPRIHFAIVCASISCPKLQNTAFTASNLEEQLINTTKEFLSDSSKNELSKDRIKLSKIFKWFKKDFEDNGSLIDFLNKYSKASIPNSTKMSFKEYDWNLND